MNGDTAKPSNEGSGVRKEVEVKNVNDKELRKLYDEKKYADVNTKCIMFETKEKTIDKIGGNDSNSGSDSSTNRRSYVNADQATIIELKNLFDGQSLNIPLKEQDDKSKANRKAKNALKQKQQAEKEAEEKGEDLDK